MGRDWPIAERAADMTGSERRQFQRLVRDLPEPTGPFAIDGGAAFVMLAPAPAARWRIFARTYWALALPLAVVVGVLVWAIVDR